MQVSLKTLFWPVLVGLLAGLLIVRELQTGSGSITSFSSAVQAASPAVVNITSKKLTRNRLSEDPFFRRLNPKRTQSSLGSGVLMREDGFIVTNHHVINGADEITVVLTDGRSELAELIGSDPDSDLAVLRIPLTGLPTIPTRDSNSMQIGDVVLAIGNPYGIGQTVTQGIISATGRHLQLNRFEDFIQTDASINPGNSGGALVDLNGNLLGINSAIFSSSRGSQGIGLAIPKETVLMVVNDLIEHGHVMRGWLGVDVEPNPNGIFITRTRPQSPAELGGLLAGDELIAIDGIPVTEARQAMIEVAMRAPGSDIIITVDRAGTRKTSVISVGLRPTS